jgi:hypothetical protein
MRVHVELFIARLPDLISNTPLVMDSISRDDSIVVLLPLATGSGNHFIASIRVDMTLRDVELSQVTSTYAKRDIEQQLDVIRQNPRRYRIYPNARTRNWLSVDWIQCPTQIASFLEEQVSTYERLHVM